MKWVILIILLALSGCASSSYSDCMHDCRATNTYNEDLMTYDERITCDLNHAYDAVFGKCDTETSGLFYDGKKVYDYCFERCTP